MIWHLVVILKCLRSRKTTFHASYCACVKATAQRGLQLLCRAYGRAADGQEQQHWIVFEVTDTGCGVTQDGLQSLFKEYVQVCPQPCTTSPVFCILCSVLLSPVLCYSARRGVKIAPAFCAIMSCSWKRMEAVAVE